MIPMYAAIYLPCVGIEEGSWEWWLKGCWMFENTAVADVAFGVAMAGVVGTALFAAMRQPKGGA